MEIVNLHLFLLSETNQADQSVIHDIFVLLFLVITLLWKTMSTTSTESVYISTTFRTSIWFIYINNLVKIDEKDKLDILLALKLYLHFMSLSANHKDYTNKRKDVSTPCEESGGYSPLSRSSSSPAIYGKFFYITIDWKIRLKIMLTSFLSFMDLYNLETTSLKISKKVTN